ncbi:hypothetical protein PPACK8108_LOCUS10192 [Phakopsora pachyrhizi]|uniref:Uncharacterized protein n=1 Tax=Phakopsora pachyrhizi TaxID=170000 RepID=A0AAV0B165_PHAPC|nr:hypothetical protein PPACK8108_LOCUS10192 [Phakopsora pachyrhizi]
MIITKERKSEHQKHPIAGKESVLPKEMSAGQKHSSLSAPRELVSEQYQEEDDEEVERNDKGKGRAESLDLSIYTLGNEKGAISRPGSRRRYSSPLAKYSTGEVEMTDSSLSASEALPAYPWDEKGKFINLSDLLKEKLDLAHSIIITHIDDSLLCRLAVDAWMKLKSLQLRDDNINKFILAFYECNLAYDILAKFPDSLGMVRDSIINSVLDTLDSYYKSSNNYNVTDLTKSLKNKDDSATALYTQLCSNGTHNPIAKHSPAACFSLHPELLTKYRKTLRDRYNKAEAHFHNSSTKPELNLASADPIENYQAEVL